MQSIELFCYFSQASYAITHLVPHRSPGHFAHRFAMHYHQWLVIGRDTLAGFRHRLDIASVGHLTRQLCSNQRT